MRGQCLFQRLEFALSLSQSLISTENSLVYIPVSPRIATELSFLARVHIYSLVFALCMYIAPIISSDFPSKM